MIPKVYIHIPELPLLINGKIDYKALPEHTYNLLDKEHVPPRTKVEYAMCAIWQDVLGIKEVGLRDDFFRIGGDSILSIHLVSTMRKHGINATILDLFENRTIERLIQTRSIKQDKKEFIAEQGILSGKFGLLPIQNWFFSKNFRKYNHWNQAILVRIPLIHMGDLQEIIVSLSKQHDILRARFGFDQSSATNFQYYLDDIPEIKIQQLNVAKYQQDEIQEKLTNWQSEFDIFNGPTWSVGLLEGYTDGSARLFMAFHHLIIDAVSWRILINDIKMLYDKQKLSKKTSSYRQWVHTINNSITINKDEEYYWRGILQNIDNKFLFKTIKKPQHSVFKIDKNLTSNLLSLANNAYNTEINDLLLTALAYALRLVNGLDTQVINLEGHGRENIDENLDLSRTCGWFTTMYPVQLELKGELDETIKHNKESMRKIPNKGIGFGSLGEISNAEVMFNYLGQFDTKSGYWQIVNEGSGISMHKENTSTSSITIICMVNDGQLQFKVVSHFAKNHHEKFSQELQKHLEIVIEHCTKQVGREIMIYTPSDFKYVNITNKQLDKLQQKYNLENLYPATSLQRGFIYKVLMHPLGDTYHLQVLYDFNCSLNISIFKKAWEEIIKNHSALRICFNWDEDFIQIITKDGVLRFTEHDISNVYDKDIAIKSIQEHDRAVPFDLTQPTLMRIHLIKQNEQCYTLLRSEHHSISDGWSSNILMRKFIEYYQSLLKSKSILNYSYDISYELSQEYIYKNQTSADDYFGNIVNKINLVNDINPMLSSLANLDLLVELEKPRKTGLSLSHETYTSILNVVKETGFTISTLLQFAWHRLISIYTQDEQTIVGTVLSGRSLPISNIESSIGLYINTLPLVIDWDNSVSIRDQLSNIQQKVFALDKYSYAHLSSLNSNGKKLFHSLFVFVNYNANTNNIAVTENEMNIEFRNSIEKIDYLLAFIVNLENNNLNLQLSYDAKYLDDKKAINLLEQVQQILKQLPSIIDSPIYNASLVSKQDSYKLTYTWNAKNNKSAPCKTISQLFEEQVLSVPNNIAIISGDDKLTYIELNMLANQFARRLLRTVKPKDLIAVYLERSIDMYIAILGILKSGCAYVPIDFDMPIDRVKYILGNADVSAVITERESDVILCDYNLVILSDKSYIKESTENLSQQCKTNDLAYVIYTSGTTGYPKGVMIEHRNILPLLLSTDYIDKRPGKVVGQVCSINFDVAVYEILGTLLNGASSIIIQQKILKSPDLFIEFILKNDIDILYLSPRYFDSIVFINTDVFAGLDYLYLGGEAANVVTINKVVSSKTPPRNFINGYGPTECSVFVTRYIIDRNIESDNVPIGSPIANAQVYVLDKNLQLVPPGVIGELYIGGDCVARGYYKQENLTNNKFIDNPYIDKQDKSTFSSRLYKTGDLVKWNQYGNLDYIGRNDFQVKIRGYRIELEEIENVIGRYSEVNVCVVLINEKNENKYLIAFIVANTKVNIDDLKNYLGDFLPEYMLPNEIIQINSIPINLSGKLDRKALLEYYDDLTHKKESFIAPSTDLEIKICAVWKDILGLDSISINSDFYDIGGNSILSIYVVANLAKNGVQCTTRNLFEHRTIKKLSLYLSSIKNEIKFIPYEILHKGNSGNPIFIFPPETSGAETYYNNIASKLLDKKLVLFNNYWFYSIKNNADLSKINTYEFLAKYYISHLQKIQQHGPYVLVGWCFGATLSLEIARQLSDLGEKVKKLVLVDPYLNFCEAEKYIKKIYGLMPQVGRLEEYKPREILLPNSEVILVKCTKKLEYDDLAEKDQINHTYAQHVSCYYTSKSDNHLKDYLRTPFITNLVEADHMSVVSEQKSIQKIVESIENDSILELQ